MNDHQAGLPRPHSRRCFWGVEAAFRKLKGVVSTSVGYTGGTLEDPGYEDVCTGGTGHAVAVEVTFNPAMITYNDLLKVFWEIHDPTTLNRQGPDIGKQYRSAIFFHTPEQENAARLSKKKLMTSGMYEDVIVTEITPASTYYLAEDYHQQYLGKRDLTACRIPT